MTTVSSALSFELNGPTPTGNLSSFHFWLNKETIYKLVFIKYVFIINKLETGYLGDCESTGKAIQIYLPFKTVFVSSPIVLLFLNGF